MNKERLIVKKQKKQQQKKKTKNIKEGGICECDVDNDFGQEEKGEEEDTYRLQRKHMTKYSSNIRNSQTRRRGKGKQETETNTKK